MPFAKFFISLALLSTWAKNPENHPDCQSTTSPGRRVLQEAGEEVAAVSALGDFRYGVTLDTSGNLRAWTLATASRLGSALPTFYDSSEGPIEILSSKTDAQAFALIGSRGRVGFGRVEAGGPTYQQLFEPGDSTRTLGAFSQDGRHWALVRQEKGRSSIRVYDTQGVLLEAPRALRAHATFIKALGEPSLWAVGTREGVECWEQAGRTLSRRLTIVLPEAPWDVQWHRDGPRLSVLHRQGAVTQHSVKTGELLSALFTLPLSIRRLGPLRFADDSGFVQTRNEQNDVVLASPHGARLDADHRALTRTFAGDVYFHQSRQAFVHYNFNSGLLSIYRQGKAPAFHHLPVGYRLTTVAPALNAVILVDPITGAPRVEHLQLEGSKP